MEKVSFGTRWFGGGGGGVETPIIPMTMTDGEEFDSEKPRKDYGPIGPMKKKKVVVEENDSAGLIFNWVSDFIRPGGGLEREEVFTMGLAPGMPPKPKIQLPVVPVAPDLKIMTTPPGHPGVIGYRTGSTASSSSGYSTSQSMNEYEPPSPPAGAYTPQFPSSHHVQYALLRQQQQQQLHPKPPLPPMPFHVKKMTSKQSSNNADMKKFAEQYGFTGTIRPNHNYRPRKGKYFKKFEEMS